MKAVLYTKPLDYAVTEVPVPDIRPDQVLIRVRVCGVCGTDVHIHHGEFIAKFPLIPGHEFVGEVARVGADVTEFAVGQRVAADNTILCGHCYYCKRNQPLYCENFYSLGCTGPGGFAEYVAVGRDKVFAIGDLPYEQAVMIEPTACAVHGLDRIHVRPGDDILMFGSGPTGIVLSQLLKHAGAANVVVAGSSEQKLRLLRNAGIDVVALDRADHSKHEKELAQRFPRGFDIVIDATGAAEVIQQCAKFAKFGGKIVIYGVAAQDDRVTVSPYDIFHKELTVIGSFAQTHCFDRAIQFIQSGVVKLDGLVTHRYGLDEFGKAIEQIEHGGGHIKVLIALP